MDRNALWARQAAPKFLAAYREFYETPFEPAVVSPEAFPHCDRAFYEVTQQHLQAHGYRFLADLVCNRTKLNFPLRPSFYRVLLSRDGAHMVTIMDCEVRGLRKVLVRLFQHLAGAQTERSGFKRISFGTALSDDTFIATANNYEWGGLFHGVEGVLSNELPEETPPEVLLQTHHRAVRRRMEQQPGVRPLVMHSLEDYVACEQRLNDYLHRHKRQIGYVSEEELVQVWGRDKAGALHRAILQLVEREEAVAA